MSTKMQDFAGQLGLAILLGLIVFPTVTLWSQNDDLRKPPNPFGDQDPRMRTQTDQVRYMSYLSTDKPIYRPGDSVFLRTVILEAFDETPYEGNFSGKVEIENPKGAKVHTQTISGENSSLGISWTIPELSEGGDYTARVTFDRTIGLPPVEREFNVRNFSTPRMRTQIEFMSKAYSEGETVTAFLEASRAEGGYPSGASVDVIARVDYQEVFRDSVTLDETGFTEVSFGLPSTIDFGDGTLTFIINDGGQKESASKTIPIVLQTVKIEAYPEGGDLIAGFNNRVYFQAHLPNGKPADLVVEVQDSNGDLVATGETYHEGRGIVEFVPEANMNYNLVVVAPETVKKSIPLKAISAGIHLRTSQDRLNADDDLELQVGTNAFSEVELKVYQRDRELVSETVTFSNNKNIEDLEIDLPDDIALNGVLRVTAFGNNTPLAERLVFVMPDDQINIEITPASDSYMPRDEMELNIKTTNGDGDPVQTFMGITVTDDSVLELIDRREQAPNLVQQVYLEPEVQEFFDTDVYLQDGEDAAFTLDLLLGTQGWRRFAFIDEATFKKEYKDRARRVIADRKEVFRPRPMPFAAMAMEENMAMPFAMAAGAPQQKAEIREDEDGIGNEGQVIDEVEIIEANFANVAEQKLDDRDNDGDLDPLIAEPVAAAPLPEAAEEMIAGDLMVADRAALRQMPLFRVFAHEVNEASTNRNDFTETVYFHTGLETDEDGIATVSFDLSDSITSFRVLVDSWSHSGALGSAESLIESKRPFYVEFKTPTAATFGDELNLPIVFINDTDETKTVQVALDITSGLQPYNGFTEITLDASSRTREVLSFTVLEESGEQTISISAKGDGVSDQVTRSFTVNPLGFPISQANSGVLEGSVEFDVLLPSEMIEGSLKTSISLYPTPLANMTSALESLIRDPYGCFEQTSSTNYPLVMAMQYFKTHQGVDPELIKRTREKLDKGYDRLIGFECSTDGYEWFGNDPAHEALTAYGLMEFIDMREVMPIDESMLQRTITYIKSQRDGEGGYKRNPKALDSFGRAPDPVTNAYITWGLAQAGVEDLDAELDAIAKAATESDDQYLLALSANALLDGGRSADAILSKLIQVQKDDGSFTKAETSITRSGGNALELETTSLAALAFMKADKQLSVAKSAVDWIHKQCEGGRFSSTQATVLALKAIIEYDKITARPKTAGVASLYVNGNFAEEISFDKDQKGSLDFASFNDMLKPGENTVRIELTKDVQFPWSSMVKYHSELPASSPDCKVELSTIIVNPVINEGESTEILVSLTNKTNEGQGMTLAKIGLPAGLEARVDQLQEMVDEGLVDFYELEPDAVVLYWRDMAPEEQHNVTISTVGQIPAKSKGPASSGYLYYEDENKHWIESMKVEIEAQ